MFIYFSRLFEKYRKRILPIAIFTYDSVKLKLAFFFRAQLQRKHYGTHHILASKRKRRGRQEGRREGRKEGVVIAQKKFICKFLNAQFGDASKDLQEKLKRQTDIELLDRLSDKIFEVRDFDGVRADIDEVLGKL